MKNEENKDIELSKEDKEQVEIAKLDKEKRMDIILSDFILNRLGVIHSIDSAFSLVLKEVMGDLENLDYKQKLYLLTRLSSMSSRQTESLGALIGGKNKDLSLLLASFNKNEYNQYNIDTEEINVFKKIEPDKLERVLRVVDHIINETNSQKDKEDKEDKE